MSKEVRNDPDIQQKLAELDRVQADFRQFDMNRMQSDMNKELEGQISKMRQEYKTHEQQVRQQLQECDSLNKNSDALKKESVQTRSKKARALVEISLKNNEFEKDMQRDNE